MLVPAHFAWVQAVEWEVCTYKVLDSGSASLPAAQAADVSWSEVWCPFLGQLCER